MNRSGQHTLPEVPFDPGGLGFPDLSGRQFVPDICLVVAAQLEQSAMPSVHYTILYTFIFVPDNRRGGQHHARVAIRRLVAKIAPINY